MWFGNVCIYLGAWRKGDRFWGGAGEAENVHIQENRLSIRSENDVENIHDVRCFGRALFVCAFETGSSDQASSQIGRNTERYKVLAPQPKWNTIFSHKLRTQIMLTMHM